MSQHITVVGQIASDPHLHTSPAGVHFCTFRLASTDRRYDREQQQWVDGTTNWYSINLFRKLAVNAHESLAKGARVILSGKLRVRRWEKEERSGTTVEIEAEAIGHDLLWGTSSFQKRLDSPSSASVAAVGANGARTGMPGSPAAHDSTAPSESDGFLPSTPGVPPIVSDTP